MEVQIRLQQIDWCLGGKHLEETGPLRSYPSGKTAQRVNNKKSDVLYLFIQIPRFVWENNWGRKFHLFINHPPYSVF